jgi:hypothetical protein
MPRSEPAKGSRIVARGLDPGKPIPGQLPAPTEPRKTSVNLTRERRRGIFHFTCYLPGALADLHHLRSPERVVPNSARACPRVKTDNQQRLNPERVGRALKALSGGRRYRGIVQLARAALLSHSALSTQRAASLGDLPFESARICRRTEPRPPGSGTERCCVTGPTSRRPQDPSKPAC